MSWNQSSFVATDARDARVTSFLGKVYGWIFMSHQIGAAIMASSAGALRTWLGDYHSAFFSGGVIALVAAGLALQIKTKPKAVPPVTVHAQPAGA